MRFQNKNSGSHIGNSFIKLAVVSLVWSYHVGYGEYVRKITAKKILLA